jgi:hypothetical protein
LEDFPHTVKSISGLAGAMKVKTLTIQINIIKTIPSQILTRCKRTSGRQSCRMRALEGAGQNCSKLYISNFSGFFLVLEYYFPAYLTESTDSSIVYATDYED